MAQIGDRTGIDNRTAFPADRGHPACLAATGKKTTTTKSTTKTV